VEVEKEKEVMEDKEKEEKVELESAEEGRRVGSAERTQYYFIQQKEKKPQ
jgi:hypothetical protein